MVSDGIDVVDGVEDWLMCADGCGSGDVLDGEYGSYVVRDDRYC
jgi:hypothetical protein